MTGLQDKQSGIVIHKLHPTFSQVIFKRRVTDILGAANLSQREIVLAIGIANTIVGEVQKYISEYHQLTMHLKGGFPDETEIGNTIEKIRNGANETGIHNSDIDLLLPRIDFLISQHTTDSEERKGLLELNGILQRGRGIYMRWMRELENELAHAS